MFSCRDATSLITEEREGALAGWMRAKFRLHLTICIHCRAYRRQLDQSIGLTKEIASEEVPAAIEESALAAFRARKG